MSFLHKIKSSVQLNLRLSLYVAFPEALFPEHVLILLFYLCTLFL